jgi:hypothetical protein
LAWLLLGKLRRAMVDPEREPLAGLVEVDETSLPFRAGDEPVRPGRSREGKLPIAGVVEIVPGVMPFPRRHGAQLIPCASPLPASKSGKQRGNYP